jgi:xanthine dehydrogenase accessory factor
VWSWALVTITETYGSSPASVGQVIAVLADGTSVGTVGGGATEYQVIQKAIKAINNGEQIFHFSFDHAENGMVCGGGMGGFGNIIGNENRLLIFGGGHVAQSLAPLAVTTGFSVTVVEDRYELEELFTDVRYVVCQAEDYERRLPLSNTTYAVICTRGHQTDHVALRFCLSKQLKYIGMIGSSKKSGIYF